MGWDVAAGDHAALDALVDPVIAAPVTLLPATELDWCAFPAGVGAVRYRRGMRPPFGHYPVIHDLLVVVDGFGELRHRGVFVDVALTDSDPAVLAAADRTAARVGWQRLIELRVMSVADRRASHEGDFP